MNNYRITNLKTNACHFLNEKEKEQFLKINNRWHYFAEDMKTIKKTDKRKKTETLLFNFVGVLLCIASYLALCELLAAIDTTTL